MENLRDLKCDIQRCCSVLKEQFNHTATTGSKVQGLQEHESSSTKLCVLTTMIRPHLEKECEQAQSKPNRKPRFRSNTAQQLSKNII